MADKSKDLAKRSSRGDVDDFLRKMAAAPALRPVDRGRLLFALDATASRGPTWDQACHIQSDMFTATADLGGLDVQMAFYRGYGDFQATPWVKDSAALVDYMTRVDCLGGRTQIERVLRHAQTEGAKRKVNALVFIGDCVEEDIDQLCAIAGELGMMGVPAFIFQEGNEPTATRAFKDIAKLSGGAHCSFDLSSAKQLRELLAAVAVYAAGGRRALEDYSKKTGGQTLRIAKQMK
jgi:hypothetical protein